MFNGTCRDCILPYLASLLPFCYPYVLLATKISSETTPLTFQQNYLETLEWHHGHVPREYVKTYKEVLICDITF